MNNHPLVAVVVPVYNVEKYIDACVASVTNQVYQNIEVILVDDASTDESGKRCDLWSKKDGRIKVVHKEKNEGLNLARKTGFESSRAQYVTFLDADDLFHEDNIAQSLRALITHKADVSIYAAREFSDSDVKDSLVIENNNCEEEPIANKEQIAEYAFFGKGNIADIKHMTVWGKLYRREIIDQVDWSVSNYRAYEDSFWTPQALLKSKKIVLMATPLMYYRRNIAYGVLGSNLGNKLTSNSVNGLAVGYLEYVALLQEFYLNLARECGFESKLDEQIQEYMLLNKTWRIDNLVNAGLLYSENNEEYVMRDLTKYIESKNEHIHNLSARIEHLENKLVAVNDKLTELEAENAKLGQSLTELLSIRRSAKLLIKNVKRKVMDFFS